MKQTIRIELDGVQIAAPPGSTYREILALACPERAARVLALRTRGDVLSLAQTASDGASVETLTYTHSEGRRIYERSLRFVFLLAARRAMPAARVRVENSMGHGVYIKLAGVAVDEGAAAAIESEMRGIIAADLPFEKLLLTRKEAIEYFAAEGQHDKVDLLRYRPFEHFFMYGLAELRNYFYGEMTASTGCLRVFTLRAWEEGMLLMMPEPTNPDVPALPPSLPKLSHIMREAARWGEILNCKDISDLNGMVKARSLREFIRVSEALHEKSIAAIADAIAQRGARMIMIAGPSSSGKTTFAHRLSIQLRVLGLRPLPVSMDDYYLNREDVPRDENGEPDLESLSALDVQLFNEQLARLLAGEPVALSHFDFTSGKRGNRAQDTAIGADQPILVEGIHALNDRLLPDVPRDQQFLVYISALTQINLDDYNRIRTTDLRLLRRMVRDMQFRGSPAERTLSMWPSVRLGEEKYIFPYQERADIMFNSSLPYELSILKKYAYEALRNIPPEHALSIQAARLVKALNYVTQADVEDEIPLNSILREFIGGCCFYKKYD